MRHTDAHQSEPRKPSLFSASRQRETDRDRILTILEAGPDADRKVRSPRYALWGGAGVGALALLGAAGTFLYNDNDHSNDPKPTNFADVALAPAPLEVNPLPLERRAPAATMRDESVAARISSMALAPPGRPADVSAAAPAALRTHGPDVLKQALKRPPKPGARDLHHGPRAVRVHTKRAPLKEVSAKAKHVVVDKAGDKAPVNAGKQHSSAPSADRDVTLLEAMVNHTQAEPGTKGSVGAQIKPKD